MNIVFEFGTEDDKKVLNFNAEWVASLSTAKFAEHEAHHALSEDQYKEIHKQAVAAVKANKKPEPVVVGVVSVTEGSTLIEATPTVVEEPKK